MAVRIRMKMLGRKHRHYFRIVAIDGHQPRDGRVIEELGSYDPMVKNTDERVKLNASRLKYWLSVGAKPSEKVAVFLRKYLAKFEQLELAPPPAPSETPVAVPAPRHRRHRRPEKPIPKFLALFRGEGFTPARRAIKGDPCSPCGLAVVLSWLVMRFDVLTLFPDMFQGYLTQSLLKLAIQQGLVEIHLWNIRDWTQGKHKSVDDRPFGGGPGMILMPGPVYDCVEAVRPLAADPGLLVLLTPAGERLTQALVRELADLPRLLLLCGRYEGFDERIRLGLRPREISVGDFVCNGGEVPAMVVIDTVIRYVPGVLGDPESLTEESHSEAGKLEYPQYTRPRIFRGMAVPDILLSGNHQAIACWRRQQSEARSPGAGRKDLYHEEQVSDPDRGAADRPGGEVHREGEGQGGQGDREGTAPPSG